MERKIKTKSNRNKATDCIKLEDDRKHIRNNIPLEDTVGIYMRGDRIKHRKNKRRGFEWFMKEEIMEMEKSGTELFLTETK